MKFKIVSTSTTPMKSSSRMFDELARYLWHRFDSAECHDWEESACMDGNTPFILFETFYEETITPDMGAILFEAGIEHLRKCGFKFRVG